MSRATLRDLACWRPVETDPHFLQLRVKDKLPTGSALFPAASLPTSTQLPFTSLVMCLLLPFQKLSPSFSSQACLATNGHNLDFFFKQVLKKNSWSCFIP